MNSNVTLIKEFHFYSDKLETLIRDTIWIIAAVGGIIVPYFFGEGGSMGASYFLFSLSLLTEIIPKIPYLKSLLGRLFQGIFCFLAIIMLICSVIMILGQTDAIFSKALLVVSFIIIVFLLIDLGIALFAPNEVFDIPKNSITNQQTAEKQLEIFLENYKKGNLGNIEGDD